MLGFFFVCFMRWVRRSQRLYEYVCLNLYVRQFAMQLLEHEYFSTFFSNTALLAWEIAFGDIHGVFSEIYLVLSVVLSLNLDF